MSKYVVPQPDELAKAHATFEATEPRAFFYRAASELVALAIRGKSKLSLAEAVAVLLQTWNSSFYRFHGPFDLQHFAAIAGLVNDNKQLLMKLR